MFRHVLCSKLHLPVFKKDEETTKCPILRRSSMGLNLRGVGDTVLFFMALLGQPTG